MMVSSLETLPAQHATRTTAARTEQMQNYRLVRDTHKRVRASDGTLARPWTFHCAGRVSGEDLMNVETIFSEWTARCRQLARKARVDAERSAELAHLNPDETLPLARKEPSLPPVRRKS
jgi:hypothetical protein